MSGLMKKNVLFLTIGPPIESPPLFRRNLTLTGLPSASNVLRQLYASKMSLRVNQYRLPWNSFVPLLVTACTRPAELRPYSAPIALTSTLNSCIESIGGTISMFWTPKPPREFSTPSM